jgi:large subunit ribosomal protein L13
MLPKTSLAKQKLRGKLKVYAGPDHPHAAQQPKPFPVTPSKASA